MSTIFNQKDIDYSKAKMFFGEELSVQKYINFRYPIFEKLTNSQLGFFWRPEEISLQKDKGDYNQLSDAHKHIFTSNLKYQILLDSVQGRGINLALAPFCTLPELESCMGVWSLMEQIHSRSYTHMIKNLYPNPEKVFDEILLDEKILARASSVTNTYDDFIEYANKFKLGYETDTLELKRKLWRLLININILEGIRFYASFAATFAFAELKLLEGSAKIIGFIARDESQHLAITQHIIKNYKTVEKDDEMLQVIKEEEKYVIKMYEDAVNQEVEWSNYLFKDGSMIGLNAELLEQYVKWTANKRMRAIGLEPLYDISVRNNPLPWVSNWLNSKEVQAAPQETEVESYIVGGIKQDIKQNEFTGFTL